MLPAALRACRSRGATLATVGVVAVLGTGIYVHGELLGRSLHYLRGMSMWGLLALVAVVAAHRLSVAGITAASVDGLPLGRAALCSESSSGCSNAMVGGSAVGVGLKVAMLRSWAVPGPEVGAAVLGAAIAPAIAMWLLAFVETAPLWMGGRHGLERAVAPAAAVAVVVQVVFWWVVLTSAGPSHRLGRALERLRDRLTVRPRRLVPPGLASRLAAYEPCHHLEHIRQAGRGITRQRGARLFGAAIASQLLLGVLLFVALRAISPGGGDATFFEVLRAFAAVRVATSFVPLPGSIGVLDVGLVTALSAAGAERPAAVAAVLVYRAATFFLPMLTGLAAALWWRRDRRRLAERAAADADEPATGTGEPAVVVPLAA